MRLPTFSNGRAHLFELDGRKRSGGWGRGGRGVRMAGGGGAGVGGRGPRGAARRHGPRAGAESEAEGGAGGPPCGGGLGVHCGRGPGAGPGRGPASTAPACGWLAWAMHGGCGACADVPAHAHGARDMGCKHLGHCLETPKINNPMPAGDLLPPVATSVGGSEAGQLRGCWLAGDVVRLKTAGVCLGHVGRDVGLLRAGLDNRGTT
jgi:hypothetical protein